MKKDRSVAGKNEATGDTIHILFDAQKNAVKSLRLLGGGTMASGRYIDMEKTERLRKEAQKDSLEKARAERDSLRKATAVKDSSAMARNPQKRGFFDKLRKKKDKTNTAPSDLVNSSSSRKEP